MTEQLVLFVACPYGGCDAYGYCPCAEDELDADGDPYDEGDQDASGVDDVREWAYARGRWLPVETVPISIDDYTPEGTPP